MCWNSFTLSLKNVFHKFYKKKTKKKVYESHCIMLGGGITCARHCVQSIIHRQCKHHSFSILTFFITYFIGQASINEENVKHLTFLRPFYNVKRSTSDITRDQSTKVTLCCRNLIHECLTHLTSLHKKKSFKRIKRFIAQKPDTHRRTLSAGKYRSEGESERMKRGRGRLQTASVDCSQV